MSGDLTGLCLYMFKWVHVKKCYKRFSTSLRYYPQHKPLFTYLDDSWLVGRLRDIPIKLSRSFAEFRRHLHVSFFAFSTFFASSTFFLLAFLLLRINIVPGCLWNKTLVNCRNKQWEPLPEYVNVMFSKKLGCLLYARIFFYSLSSLLRELGSLW